jgi:hypothetical protein
MDRLDSACAAPHLGDLQRLGGSPSLGLNLGQELVDGVDQPQLILPDFVHGDAPERHAVHGSRHVVE